MVLAKRTRNLFDPTSSEPFKLSRSRLKSFLPSFLPREKLWELFFSKKPLTQDVHFKDSAKGSDDFNGAEITGAVEEATDQLIDWKLVKQKSDSHPRRFVERRR